MQRRSIIPRLAINGRFLGQNITGTQRFALEVVKRLDIFAGIMGNSLNIVIFTTQKTEPKDINLQNIPIIKIGILSGHLWEQIDLPRHLNGRHLVNLIGTAPWSIINQTVVIHDCAPLTLPNEYSGPFRAWYSASFRILTRLSNNIITVSGFSRNEIKKHLPHCIHKTHVVGEGHEHILEATSKHVSLDKWGLKSKGYVLGVSSISPRKNFQLLLRAACDLPDNILVVIAGMKSHAAFKSLSQKKHKNIKWLGRVSDSDLKCLYENALCFCYPSYYEGFGLPPLESMALGCPTIASDCSSIPEVVGDASILINPRSHHSLTKAILDIIGDPEKSQKISELGKKRARLFRWDDVALRVLKIASGQSNTELEPVSKHINLK